MAARALAEDFKDEQRPVVDGQIQVALQVALLGRAQRLVEKDFIGAQLLGQGLDLVGLALADEQCGIRRLAFADNACDRLQARGLREQAELFQLGVEMGQAQVHTHQDGGSGWAIGRFGTQVQEIR